MCSFRTWVGEQTGSNPWAPLYAGSIPSVLSFFLGVPYLFQLFLLGVVWFYNRSEYLYKTWYTRYYIPLWRTWYDVPNMRHTYRLLLPLFLLVFAGVVTAAAAAVRRCVPDGTKCWRFSESYSIQCFHSLYPNTNFSRVCSARYVASHTAGIYRRYYRYRTLRQVRHINTGTGQLGKFGTTSIPVPYTSVSSVRYGYRYRRYRYRVSCRYRTLR